VNLGKARSIVIRSAFAFSLFGVATFLADFALGPLLTKVFDNPAYAKGALWVVFIPLLVENGLILIVFGLAAKTIVRTLR